MAGFNIGYSDLFCVMANTTMQILSPTSGFLIRSELDRDFRVCRDLEAFDSL